MQTTPKNVAYSPQDASIDTLRIYPAGNRFGVDVSKILVELSYFEDMYSFVVSGYIILRDGIGLVEKLQLSGKETIKISFGKTREGKPNVAKDFRIYSIPDRKPVGNLTTEYVKLYFCSPELFYSEQTKVIKSYKGKTIQNIVYDIISNQMRSGLDKVKKINFEPTTGVYDFVIPTLKPFEAISWMSTYAKPFTYSETADMLFYETKDGFEFRSLNSIYKTEPYKTYRYDVKNIEGQSFEQKITSVLDYQFIKGFDSLNEINSGTFVNRVMAFDPIQRTLNVSDYDYKKDYKGAKLNKGGPTDVSEYDEFDGAAKGALKLVATNSGQKQKQTLNIFRSNLAPDVFVQQTVQNRTAHLALSNYTILKIRIPGDTGLKAGSVINFNILSLDSSKEKRDLDKFYSGKYLVTAVRHIIQSQGVFQTVLEITKGSSQGEYQDYR